MYDKYLKLMESLVDSNGEINMNHEIMLKMLTDDSSWDTWKYDHYENNTPKAIEQEYHYVDICINGYDDLIVEKNITKSFKKPKNKKSGYHITIYSENEITTEEIDEQIELLYQEYITDIKIKEKILKNKVDSKNKIFKQHLRNRKMTNLIKKTL